MLRNIKALNVSKLLIINTKENPKFAIRIAIINGKRAIVKFSVP